jgi:hypothetical protein
MKFRKILANVTLMVVTTGITLFLGEFVARRFLNPSDYLGVEMLQDDVLGAVPSATAKAGFDAWGFRNREVPKTADIVAVGDSHTFGNTAKMDESWPYVLGRLTGRHVYNMGMGGYGPNQYFHLSNSKALSLQPNMIVWGLYMGDDFQNAFAITYGLNYWANLRKLPSKNVDADIWDPPAPKPTWLKRVRVWLSGHSVIYQLVFHASPGGRLQGEAQIRNAAQLYPGAATSLIVPTKNILEAFRPQSMLSRLDQDNPDIREGMRITFELIKNMNEICQQRHIRFVVVVIPIKEEVFSDYLEHNAKLPLGDVVDKLMPNDRLARQKTFAFLTESNIPYVDPLPALKSSLGNELYARSATDMHPSKNGYRVIGEAVSEAYKKEPEAFQASH